MQVFLYFFETGFCFGLILAPVDQTLDSALHRINYYPRDKYWWTNYAIHRLEVYPVDSVIQLFSAFLLHN